VDSFHSLDLLLPFGMRRYWRCYELEEEKEEEGTSTYAPT
jgi:hypothetical protein